MLVISIKLLFLKKLYISNCYVIYSRPSQVLPVYHRYSSPSSKPSCTLVICKQINNFNCLSFRQFLGITDAFLHLQNQRKEDIEDGGDKKRIKDWVDGCIDRSYGHSSVRKVDQLKGGRGFSMDLHHHWEHYCSSSVDPCNGSLLQLCWSQHAYGLKERQEGQGDCDSSGHRASTCQAIRG
jgi:hypothetical protein